MKMIRPDTDALDGVLRGGAGLCACGVGFRRHGGLRHEAGVARQRPYARIFA